MTDDELKDKLLREYKEKQAVNTKEEVERQKRMKGYRFWCSEGCGFVDEFHRCEQWTHITYVSPQLYEAICKEKT